MNHTPPQFRQHRGVSLIFALVTLVALSLAAVALVRSVNTSALITGNLGFKQDTIAYAAQASEAAIDYLKFNLKTNVLNGDDADKGYYATAYVALDPANRRPTDPNRWVIDWNGNSCATGYEGGTFAGCLKSLPAVVSGNENSTRYTIVRLCNLAGSAYDSANSCARPVNASYSDGGERGECNYQRCREVELIEGGPYYRILVRSVGARNTVSFTETLVHF